EGRLVYQDAGLHLLLDLGKWWEQETGLPLPLGANVIRNSLDRSLSDDLIGAIGESIRWAADHRDEILDALAEHGRARGLDRAKLAHYLDLYANEDTAGYDETCQQAIWELLRRIREAVVDGRGPHARPGVDQRRRVPSQGRRASATAAAAWAAFSFHSSWAVGPTRLAMPRTQAAGTKSRSAARKKACASRCSPSMPLALARDSALAASRVTAGTVARPTRGKPAAARASTSAASACATICAGPGT